VRLQQQQQYTVDNFPYFPARIVQELPFEAVELAVRVGIAQDEYFEPDLPAVVKLPSLPRALYNLPYIRGDPSLLAEDEGGVRGKLLILVFWRPNYKPSTQAMSLFNDIQERFPQCVHVLGIIEPMYENQLSNAGAATPRNVVVDSASRVAKELGVNLAPSSTGLPAAFFCLPGRSTSSGVIAAGAEGEDCHKVMFALDSRRVVSKNTGRALSAMLTAFGGYCTDRERQEGLIECAREVGAMDGWSMPSWANEDQWARIQEDKVGGENTAANVLACKRGVYSSQASLAVNMPPPAPTASPDNVNNNNYETTEYKQSGGPLPVGDANAAAASGGLSGMLVGGIMYMLGGSDAPKAAAAAAAPSSSSVPSDSSTSGGVPSYATRGAEYSQEQLYALQQQRDKLAELAKGMNEGEYEEEEGEEGIVTTETSELEPEVQVHFEVVQSMLQSCVEREGEGEGEGPLRLLLDAARGDERLLGVSASPETPGYGDNSDRRQMDRREYLARYASMWSLLDSMVHAAGPNSSTEAGPGHFLPMLHHRMSASPPVRTRTASASTGGRAGAGKSNVGAYELQSLSLSGGSLHALQYEELELVLNKYGYTVSDCDDDPSVCAAAVDDWLRDHAPGGASPQGSPRLSLANPGAADVSSISNNKAGVSFVSTPGGGAGGPLGEKEPRWDYVYRSLRLGLYAQALEEVSTAAAALPPSSSGDSSRGGKSSHSRGYRSQTVAGRAREKAREAANREVHLVHCVCRILKGLAANSPAVGGSSSSNTSGSSSGSSNSNNPGATPGPGGMRGRSAGGGTPGGWGASRGKGGDSDLTSDAVVEAVTSVREYYLHHCHSQQRQEAEQSYNRTHDTHHHHHHHHHHGAGAGGESALEPHKEALVLLLGFFEHASVMGQLRRLALTDGNNANPGQDVLWASLFQMHYSRRFLELQEDGYQPSSPYEEELLCCLGPTGLYEELMVKGGLDAANQAASASGSSSSSASVGGGDNSFMMSPASNAITAGGSTPYAHSYSVGAGTPYASAVATVSGDTSGAGAAGRLDPTDVFAQVRVLLCCQQFSAAVSHLAGAGEVVPAVHLAAVLLYYGLLHSQEPLLRRVGADDFPSDSTVASLIQSYAFPPVYPFVSLAYVLLLVLPQQVPSLRFHSPGWVSASATSSSFSSNTLVVGGGSTTTEAFPAPLLLEDISSFAHALEALFVQVGGGTQSPAVVTELVEVMADLYFPRTGEADGAGSARETLATVLSIIAQRAVGVHKRVGEAMFYYSLAEQYRPGTGSNMNTGDDGQALPEALLALLQQLVAQMQSEVRPAGAGATESRRRVRDDARALLGELFAFANEGGGDAQPDAPPTLLTALAGAGDSVLLRIGSACCELCNLETTAQFLDLCREVDDCTSSSSSSSSSGDSSGSSGLELDLLVLLEERMKPLVWHFVDPTLQHQRDNSHGEGGSPPSSSSSVLFRELVPLPFLPAADQHAQSALRLLSSQSRSGAALYRDLLQHAASYLKRLLAYVRQGYGSSFTADTDRRLVDDMLQIVGRIESLSTAF
jgi:hypothetical protein